MLLVMVLFSNISFPPPITVMPKCFVPITVFLAFIIILESFNVNDALGSMVRLPSTYIVLPSMIVLLYTMNAGSRSNVPGITTNDCARSAQFLRGSGTASLKLLSVKEYPSLTTTVFSMLSELPL